MGNTIFSISGDSDAQQLTPWCERLDVSTPFEYFVHKKN